jgi:drug/metabolite transporter (DMT)-like permease
VLIVLAFALRTGIATLRTRRFGLHLWRNGVHLGGQASWVYAIGALPLATVFAIEFTSPMAVLFWMSVIQTPVCLAAALPGWTAPALADFPWILAIGAGSFTAHYCMTRAMKLADAMVIVPVDYFRPPLIAVVGAVFYAEAFDPMVFLGAAMIFAGVWYSLAREHCRVDAPHAS